MAMKAKFVGDPSQQDEALPAVHTAYGIDFEKGKFAEIPDDLAEKFENNSHFEVQGKAADADKA